MHVAYELKKDLDEVEHWPPSRVMMWVAFFKVRKEEMEEAAAEAARRR